jgi:hypothetical protein
VFDGIAPDLEERAGALGYLTSSRQNPFCKSGMLSSFRFHEGFEEHSSAKCFATCKRCSSIWRSRSSVQSGGPRSLVS